MLEHGTRGTFLFFFMAQVALRLKWSALAVQACTWAMRSATDNVAYYARILSCVVSNNGDLYVLSFWALLVFLFAVPPLERELDDTETAGGCTSHFEVLLLMSFFDVCPTRSRVFFFSRTKWWSGAHMQSWNSPVLNCFACAYDL